MALYEKISATWKPLLPYINVSGTWKPATVWQKVAGTWKQINSLYSASVPSTASASGNTANRATAVQTCTPSGGTSPYTYQWAYVSGSTQISIGSDTSASTDFTAVGLTSPETRVAVFNCTVIDNLGNVAVSNNITVTISRT